MSRRTITTARAAKGDHVTVEMEGDRIVSVKAHGPYFHPLTQRGDPVAVQPHSPVDHALPTFAPSRSSKQGRADAERMHREDNPNEGRG